MKRMTSYLQRMNCSVLLLEQRILPLVMMALPIRCSVSFRKFLAAPSYIYSIFATAGGMCLQPGPLVQLYRFQSLELTNSDLFPSLPALVRCLNASFLPGSCIV